jgi:hypothetical protein
MGGRYSTPGIITNKYNIFIRKLQRKTAPDTTGTQTTTILMEQRVVNRSVKLK